MLADSTDIAGTTVSAPRVLASVWMPLSRAAMCLEDETVFDVGEGQCPVCGSEHFVLLTRWLTERAS